MFEKTHIKEIVRNDLMQLFIKMVTSDDDWPENRLAGGEFWREINLNNRGGKGVEREGKEVRGVSGKVEG